jgi:hypothetical protein
MSEAFEGHDGSTSDNARQCRKHLSPPNSPANRGEAQSQYSKCRSIWCANTVSKQPYDGNNPEDNRKDCSDPHACDYRADRRTSVQF